MRLFIVLRLFIRWPSPFNFHLPFMLTIDLYHQICFNTEMHRKLLSFLLMENIFDLYFWEFLSYEGTLVWIVYLSFLDYIVLLESVFVTIMLDINPKLIFITQNIQNFNLILRFLQFLLDNSIQISISIFRNWFILSSILFLFYLQLYLIIFLL